VKRKIVSRRRAAAARGRSTRVRLTHFGAAGWEINDGRRVILLDPYFSRVRFTGRAFGVPTSPAVPGDARPIFGPDDPPVSDTEAISAHIRGADCILISHSHFNHCMDMPFIARTTGASVIGTESTINVARACGVPEEQLIPVRGGEDYEFDGFSVKVIPSLHSAMNDKRYFNSAAIPRDVRAPPRLRDYVEGGTLAYFIRLGGHRILAFCSMNYVEREIEGLRPDVVLIPAARARLEIHEYTRRLLRAVGFPPMVIATHWDTQSAPYGVSQEAELEQAESFVSEVRAASPKTRVVVPRHFDSIVLDRRSGRRGSR